MANHRLLRTREKHTRRRSSALASNGKESCAQVLKLVIVSSALCAFVGTLFTFTLRGTLLLGFVPSVVALLWCRRSLARAALLIGGIDLALAVTPVDIGFDVTGNFGVDIRPILWGLPNENGREMIRRKEVYPGGCIVSVYPARYAVVVTR